MIALSQGVILEEPVSHDPDEDCLENGLQNSIIHIQDEAHAGVKNAKVQMSMEIKKISGIEGSPKKRFIDYDQVGFGEKWNQLIRAENGNDRKKAMRDICSDMDQDTAVAFAGYMGNKNSDIYDYRRVTTTESEFSEEEYAKEIISADDYYQTHRNNEGIGDPAGRTKMGVCGDSAKMVSDFLSNCGFSCEDIDIVGYRTLNGGHEMVTARGESGEYYTANWSEATASTGSNPLQYQSPDPNLTRTGPVVDVFDCRGRPKDKTTTPLGTILMMAHEDSHTLNFGQEYDELALVIEELGGVDEIKLKAFRGRGNDGQKVEGLAANIFHEFGDDMDLFRLKMYGSLVLAKAQRDIQQYEGETTSLDQLIFSPHVNSRLSLNAIRSQSFQAGIFVEGDATGFVMRNEQTSTFNEDAQKGTSADQMVRTGVGASARWQTDNTYFSTEAGVRSFATRSVNQKGGKVEDDGRITKEKIILRPNQVFANGRMEVAHTDQNFTSVDINYRNELLVDRSLLDVSAAHRFKNTEISTGVSVIKNPDQETIKALNLGLSQRVRVRDNYVEVSGGIQYLIVENMPDTKMFSVSVAYAF